MLITWLVLLAVTNGDPDPFAAPFPALAPLTTTTVAATSLPCASCHVEIASEHEGSRHARSADNALFAAGFARERHPRCAYCHAPVDDAALELLRSPTTTRSSRAGHAGVDCIACHVREGSVWSGRAARGYGHVVEVSPSLADGTLCARCHEFSAHDVVDGVTRLLPDTPMQSTASEHRAFVAAGGVGTCMSCHMPVVDGRASHAFLAGAHDVDALRDALVADIADDGRSVVLSSRGVGHGYPTGDVFRRLVVSVDDVVVMTIGVRRGDSDSGPWQPALMPGERRVLALPRGRVLRVTYHRADDAEEARGDVSFDELVSVLVTRPLSQRGRR